MPFLVMARTVIKSILRRPYTVKYPFGPRVYHGSITRGSVAIDIKQCIFCGTCEKKCPTGALAVSREEKRWTIDRLRCVTCGYCVESCPKKCLGMQNQYSQPLLERKKESFENA
jgi:formate hydrogenlyase subunit 6/NADH:ubiquinone oxidoreductase subunit I